MQHEKKSDLAHCGSLAGHLFLCISFYGNGVSEAGLGSVESDSVPYQALLFCSPWTSEFRMDFVCFSDWAAQACGVPVTPPGMEPAPQPWKRRG